jgi:hypothetical protein
MPKLIHKHLCKSGGIRGEMFNLFELFHFLSPAIHRQRGGFPRIIHSFFELALNLVSTVSTGPTTTTTNFIFISSSEPNLWKTLERSLA